MVGIHLSGEFLLPDSPRDPGDGALGCPRWSRLGLLADLEMRLGLPSASDGELAARGRRYQQRIATELRDDDFFARSFRADPMRTSHELLKWRDQLMEAGWNGQPPAGQARISSLARMETDGARFALGVGDRLRAVARALSEGQQVPYSSLALIDDEDLWPGRWREIFSLLRKQGVEVLRATSTLSHVRANPECDLGWLQSRVLGEAEQRGELRADGSLVILRGGTPVELAEAVAALVAEAPTELTVIRDGETELLDAALARYGASSQGSGSSSTHRPLLQLAGLLLSLSFEKRDPEQLLQLLLLRKGPFDNKAGRALVEAFTAKPGIENAEWTQLLDEHKDPFAPLFSALRGPGWPRAGAPLDEVYATLNSAESLLQERANKGNKQTRVALLAVSGMRESLDSVGSTTVDWTTCRQLIVAAQQESWLASRVEQSGRACFVDSASRLHDGVERALFWNAVGELRLKRSPLRSEELRALAEQGATFPDEERQLAALANSYRRAILAPQKQLILAVARTSERQVNRTHPLLDEVQARLRLSDAQLAAITVSTSELRSGASSLLRAETVEARNLILPQPETVWSVEAGAVPDRATISASSLYTLLKCPLRWTLDHHLGLRHAGAPSLPARPIAFGKLGHHLVERLHDDSAFERSPTELRSRCEHLFDLLVAEEMMELLGEGQSFEYQNLKHVLRRSVEGLARMLREHDLRLVAVEHELQGELCGKELKGSIDVLLQDAAGGDVILDLKWGKSTYYDLLKDGRALQLAVYAEARRRSTGAENFPPSGYYALRAGVALASDAAAVLGAAPIKGPPVVKTWKRAERTLPLVERSLTEGKILVGGLMVGSSVLQLLGREGQEAEYLNLRKDERDGSCSVCKYCTYEALCGRQWEGGL